MMFDEMLDAFAFAEELPDAAIESALEGWAHHGPRCRALLQGYVAGEDFSERTERAMLVIIHLLGEREDTASFPALCALGLDAARLESALGEQGVLLSYQPVLISTYGGDPAPLHALIESPTADELARGDALLVMAYLVRTDRMPEREAYGYLAALPDRLSAEPGNFVWYGYARAVAALGFTGLAGAVESVIGRGLLPSDLMSSEDFWSDLRACQQDPRDFSHPIWSGCEPAGSAIERLLMLNGDDEMEGAALDDVVSEPIRNPLRNVGRNDPCPCGSGKKFKKCCLQVGLA